MKRFSAIKNIYNLVKTGEESEEQVAPTTETPAAEEESPDDWTAQSQPEVPAIQPGVESQTPGPTGVATPSDSPAPTQEERKEAEDLIQNNISEFFVKEYDKKFPDLAESALAYLFDSQDADDFFYLKRNGIRLYKDYPDKILKFLTESRDPIRPVFYFILGIDKEYPETFNDYKSMFYRQPPYSPYEIKDYLVNHLYLFNKDDLVNAIKERAKDIEKALEPGALESEMTRGNLIESIRWVAFLIKDIDKSFVSENKEKLEGAFDIIFGKLFQISDEEITNFMSLSERNHLLGERNTMLQIYLESDIRSIFPQYTSLTSKLRMYYYLKYQELDPDRDRVRNVIAQKLAEGDGLYYFKDLPDELKTKESTEAMLFGYGKRMEEALFNPDDDDDDATEWVDGDFNKFLKYTEALFGETFSSTDPDYDSNIIKEFGGKKYNVDLNYIIEELLHPDLYNRLDKSHQLFVNFIFKHKFNLLFKDKLEEIFKYKIGKIARVQPYRGEDSYGFLRVDLLNESIIDIIIQEHESIWNLLKDTVLANAKSLWVTEFSDKFPQHDEDIIYSLEDSARLLRMDALAFLVGENENFFNRNRNLIKEIVFSQLKRSGIMNSYFKFWEKYFPEFMDEKIGSKEENPLEVFLDNNPAAFFRPEKNIGGPSERESLSLIDKYPEAISLAANKLIFNKRLSITKTIFDPEKFNFLLNTEQIPIEIKEDIINSERFKEASYNTLTVHSNNSKRLLEISREIFEPIIKNFIKIELNEWDENGVPLKNISSSASPPLFYDFILADDSPLQMSELKQEAIRVIIKCSKKLVHLLRFIKDNFVEDPQLLRSYLSEITEDDFLKIINFNDSKFMEVKKVILDYSIDNPEDNLRPALLRALEGGYSNLDKYLLHLINDGNWPSGKAILDLVSNIFGLVANEYKEKLYKENPVAYAIAALDSLSITASLKLKEKNRQFERVRNIVHNYFGPNDIGPLLHLLESNVSLEDIYKSISQPTPAPGSPSTRSLAMYKAISLLASDSNMPEEISEKLKSKLKDFVIKYDTAKYLGDLRKLKESEQSLTAEEIGEKEGANIARAVETYLDKTDLGGRGSGDLSPQGVINKVSALDVIKSYASLIPNGINFENRDLYLLKIIEKNINRGDVHVLYFESAEALGSFGLNFETLNQDSEYQEKLKEIKKFVLQNIQSYFSTFIYKRYFEFFSKDEINWAISEAFKANYASMRSSVVNSAKAIKEIDSEISESIIEKITDIFIENKDFDSMITGIIYPKDGANNQEFISDLVSNFVNNARDNKVKGNIWPEHWEALLDLVGSASRERLFELVYGLYGWKKWSKRPFEQFASENKDLVKEVAAKIIKNIEEEGAFAARSRNQRVFQLGFSDRLKLAFETPGVSEDPGVQDKIIELFKSGEFSTSSNERTTHIRYKGRDLVSKTQFVINFYSLLSENRDLIDLNIDIPVLRGIKNRETAIEILKISDNDNFLKGTLASSEDKERLENGLKEFEDLKVNTSIYQDSQRPQHWKGETTRYTLSQINKRPPESIYKINKKLIHAGDGIEHTNVGVSGFTSAWALFSIQSDDEDSKDYFVVEQYQSDYPVVLANYFNVETNGPEWYRNKAVSYDQAVAMNDSLKEQHGNEYKDIVAHFNIISAAYPYLVLAKCIDVAKLAGMSHIYILKRAAQLANIANHEKAKSLYEDIPLEFSSGSKNINDEECWEIQATDGIKARMMARAREITGRSDNYDFSLTPAQNSRERTRERERKRRTPWAATAEKIERLNEINNELKERFPDINVPEFTNPTDIIRFLNEEIRKKINKKQFNAEFNPLIRELSILKRAWDRMLKLKKFASLSVKKSRLRSIENIYLAARFPGFLE
jgi:hypothetical protein